MEIRDALRRYRNHMLAIGNSRYTIVGAQSSIGRFINFMETLGIIDIAQLNRDALMRYREDLAWHLTEKGTPLTIATQLQHINRLASFFRFLVLEGWILSDPCKGIPRPRRPKRLPRNILDQEEVNDVLNMPSTTTLRGYRDRVILEILYSSAIRRAEVANLELADVDTDGGYLHINDGKGNKDRVVPLGRTACEFLESYLKGVRPEWPNANKQKHLFLSIRGTPLKPNSIWQMVRTYGDLSTIKKRVTPHAFRHSCATHLLKNGAPIRQLQELLGHESLESTQVYTRVTITDLQEMHRKFHPRERAAKAQAASKGNSETGPPSESSE